MKIRLGKNQRHLIQRMKSGWELGVSTTMMGGGCWLQEGGIGKGGKAESVDSNVVWSLRQKGLIKQIYGFPAATYILTDKAREI